MLDWVKKAREQARSVHPDVTAVFIGANDGFPMKTRGGASVRVLRAPLGRGVRAARGVDDALLPARRALATCTG